MRWPLQPLQPLQQTQLQPPFGQSVDSLCHPWFTTTNVSYRFPILKLSPPPCAVLLVHIYIYIYIWCRMCKGNCMINAVSTGEFRAHRICLHLWRFHPSCAAGDRPPCSAKKRFFLGRQGLHYPGMFWKCWRSLKIEPEPSNIHHIGTDLMMKFDPSLRWQPSNSTRRSERPVQPVAVPKCSWMEFSVGLCINLTDWGCITNRLG